MLKLKWRKLEPTPIQIELPAPASQNKVAAISVFDQKATQPSYEIAAHRMTDNHF